MTFLTVIFRWRPLYRYKIQSSKHLDPATLPRLFSTLIMVQVTVFLPVSLCLAWVSQHTSWGLWTDGASLALPSNRALVLHILGYAAVDEIFFYSAHRLAHHRSVYQHVHKVRLTWQSATFQFAFMCLFQIHHQWTAPIALASDYCHPAEHLLVNVLPNISYALLLGSDPFTYLMWWLLVYLGSQTNHSGYR